MADFSIQTDRNYVEQFADGRHLSLIVDAFLEAPDKVIEHATLQKFALITPQYPGLRAPLDPEVASQWARALSPLLSKVFDCADGEWSIQAWHSIVMRQPGDLLPIQCLPHVDGTDPNQVAMMLYLDDTAHGGTAFYRHLSTGLDALTNETFPQYKAALESDVARVGLPPRRYISDGSPLFERTHQTPGAFNQAVFYRGNLLHSGVIDNEAPLESDPRTGRYTINAFLRPPSRS